LLFVFKAFGVSKEEFDSYIANGIIMWGQSVTDVLEEGQLRIRQTINSEMTPLVSILIEGMFILSTVSSENFRTYASDSEKFKSINCQN
jgi:hypothetical protein